MTGGLKRRLQRTYVARKVAGRMVCGLMTQRNWDFLIGREMVCTWQQSKRDTATLAPGPGYMGYWREDMKTEAQ